MQKTSLLAQTFIYFDKILCKIRSYIHNEISVLAYFRNKLDYICYYLKQMDKDELLMAYTVRI